MVEVFISAAPEDKGFVRELREALAARNRQTFVTWPEDAILTQTQNDVLSVIEAAHAVVFVVSPEALALDLCMQHLEHAARYNKRLIALIRREGGPQDIPYLDAASQWISFQEHDDFTRSLDSLLLVLDANVAWVRAHTRWLLRALEWDRHQKHYSFLLPRNELLGAEQWLARGQDQDPPPTPIQRQYIEASRAAIAQKQQLLLGGSALGVLLALLVGVFVWWTAESPSSTNDYAAVTPPPPSSAPPSDPQPPVSDEPSTAFVPQDTPSPPFSEEATGDTPAEVGPSPPEPQENAFVPGHQEIPPAEYQLPSPEEPSRGSSQLPPDSAIPPPAEYPQGSVQEDSARDRYAVLPPGRSRDGSPPVKPPLTDQTTPVTPGMYRVVVATPVLNQPQAEARVIARLAPPKRVQVVGAAGQYVKIRSKHNRPPGYVLRSAVTGPLTDVPPGEYAVITATPVLSQPRVGASVIVHLEPAARVRVVGAIGSYLKVSSKHGRPPGYVRRDAVDVTAED